MFWTQLKCDSFRSFLEHFSVLDQNETFRERMNSLNTQWDKKKIIITRVGEEKQRLFFVFHLLSNMTMRS
jgi:hypothetical protein